MTAAEFAAVDIRVGTIVDVRPNTSARKPALRLTIDFGPALGRKVSSAQITRHYRPETLLGRQVAAVVGLPVLRIADVVSEVLVLGFPDGDGEVVLVRPDFPVPDGGRLF